MKQETEELMPQEAGLSEGEELLVEMYPPIEDQSSKIIKVIGVGGGGSNAVKNMYNTTPQGVRFAVCNTDSQALHNCNVPVRIMLGKDGLGAGGRPEVARQAAEYSLEQTARLFEDETRMVFITAGLGGGTGTGAAPVIARQARERGILTIGVVTLPFAFERHRSMDKALRGLQALRESVDAMLVINNERLLEVFGDGKTSALDAFKHADQVLSRATLSIAEIITKEGIINCDFCDVESTMKDSGSAIISEGYGRGEGRLFHAVQQALNSPLLTGIKIEQTRRILCIVYTGQDNPVLASELYEIQDFMERLSPDVEFIFGFYSDESLGDEAKVSIIASGFDTDFPDEIEALRSKYYGNERRLSQAPQPEVSVEPIAEQEAAPDADPAASSDSSTSSASEGGRPAVLTWRERISQYISNIFEEEIPNL